MLSEINFIEWVMISARWVHAVSATTWLGGSVFFAVVLNPVYKMNSEKIGALMGPINNIYKELVDISIVALIVSGLILMFDALTGKPATITWFLIFGLKLVIALWMFFLVWRFRQAHYKQLSVNPVLRPISHLFGYNAMIFLGLIVFFLAAVLNELITK